MNRFIFRHILTATLLAAVAGPVTSAAAEPKAAEPTQQADAPKVEAESTEKPGPSFRAAIRAMVEQEAQKTGLPADIADAVVYVESNYDPTVIGGVGEIGLMQIRPGTAAMLGFRGSAGDLAKPEVNIHYGISYLSKAWRLANGDLCRTLVKYRAGHGEETMTPRSVNYCNRARNHLAALVAADFAEGRLRAVPAGDACGEPGLLGSTRSPRPRDQGTDRIQMAPTGVAVREQRAAKAT